MKTNCLFGACYLWWKLGGRIHAKKLDVFPYLHFYVVVRDRARIDIFNEDECALYFSPILRVFLQYRG